MELKEKNSSSSEVELCNEVVVSMITLFCLVNKFIPSTRARADDHSGGYFKEKENHPSKFGTLF